MKGLSARALATVPHCMENKFPMMTHMWRGILCAVLLFATALIAGENSNTLVYSHFANVGPLNPHMYAPNQMFAQEMVYEPLVRLGENGEIIPCLATRWDISDDGLVYTFRLRDDVRFTDGEPFTADAVVENFRHILANKPRHVWLDLTNRIESVTALAPFSVEIRLNTPYYPILDDLSLPRPFRFISPAALPDSGTTRDGIKKPVGTGPWTLSETRLGEYDLFSKNPGYWGEQPAIDHILIKVIPDPMSRAMALETGEIDLVYGIGQIHFDTFAAFRNNPAFTTAISSPVGGTALALNSARGPTGELAVRRAIQHLCDKDAIIAGVFLDTQPKADFYFSPTVPYADVGLSPYAFDPAKAAALLDGAGWGMGASGIREKDGRPLAIDMCFVGNDASQRALAEVLQGQMAEGGIFLNLIAEEEDSFLRRQREGEFGIIVNSTWGPPFEPHAMLGSMRSASHADYQAQLGLAMKPELDRAITRVVETTDPEERRNLYSEILYTLHEQAIYLPIHYTALLAVWREGRPGNFSFGPGKSDYPFERYVIPETE